MDRDRPGLGAGTGDINHELSITSLMHFYYQNDSFMIT